MSDEYLKQILNARVYDVAKETDLVLAKRLSKTLKHNIHLKREDQQPVFSFKIRGAHNCLSQLSDAQKAKGVITASAGNHAQGVALSAQHLGCEALIVMPTTTPEIKRKAVASYGAKIELFGDSFSDAATHALKISAETGKKFIPPFDDPAVIAGQGTVAAEILRQFNQPVDAVFIPVGGGGLIAGMSTFLKSVRPDIRIIAVEPDNSDAMTQSLAAGERVELNEVGIFADGVAVKKVGAETFRLCQKHVDECITVSTDEICAAIKDIFEETRSIMEPSGALGLAGIKKWCLQHPEKTGLNLITITSGANMNFDRLRHVSERTEIGEGKEAIFAATIPEKRGAFLEFCRSLKGCEVTEFNYRYASSNDAHIFVGVRAETRQLASDCVKNLQSSGYACFDMSDNSMAKVHGRHLAGGRTPTLANEHLLSFQFPERPGALLNFLEQICNRWNITLFHYRNHGSDFGRILCGLEVPPETEEEFSAFLQTLGYPYKDETDNVFYHLFL